MIITKEQLKELDPCTDGYEYWLKINKQDLEEFMLQAWEDDHADWANWLFVRAVPRELYLKYAIYSAELVLPIFEKQYPDDKRPRNTIDVAKKVLEDDSQQNRNAAAAAAGVYAAYATSATTTAAAYAATTTTTAAYAAAAADYAAYAAAAADDAAATAYFSAAAADYAAATADDAYFSTDYTATKRKTQKQIIDYGIKILREYEGIEL